jgi:hypothetical protein
MNAYLVWKMKLEAIELGIEHLIVFPKEVLLCKN